MSKRIPAKLIRPPGGQIRHGYGGLHARQPEETGHARPTPCGCVRPHRLRSRERARWPRFQSSTQNLLRFFELGLVEDQMFVPALARCVCFTHLMYIIPPYMYISKEHESWPRPLPYEIIVPTVCSQVDSLSLHSYTLPSLHIPL